VKSFEDPLADHGSFVHAFGFCEASHALKLLWGQIDAELCVFGAGKHGFADLLQSLCKVREIVRVPQSAYPHLSLPRKVTRELPA